ncbi:metal ABC transporter solute-binding protein, Zn/Mn family [Ornithinibacillus halophilus]|uniref:Zinc transport system substrate-binding protein n=1 Tax=Ornithinibacillus halophilus TaxID=930117 RepID=A0A1M5F7E2_9BACI|nr:zinc ABC transporter substrate-binding protein [Ornithinibacillus halophilus]SHF87429.1 zinc transport system substrate-binding protein [Ornithinibacillus halophilus]
MKKILILLLFIGIYLTGCATTSSDTVDNDGITIYTSVYPIQYIVERIGGETINVKSVFPLGVDAHTYEPTSKEMTEIARSDMFIYLGAGMEGFAESMAGALKSQDVKLIELGEEEELFHSEETEQHEEDDDHDGHNHNHGDHDPHIWLDPIRMIEMAHIITSNLEELNPEKKDDYQENIIALEEDLRKLDDKFVTTLEEKSNKKLLVSHAAYGYWEERYGIEQISINGLSSSSEPSQKELTKIIEEANAHTIKYIIFEQNTSSRVSEIVQDHINAEALIIHNLSVLTEDDIENNEDYISLMEQNLNVLDQATN